MKARLFAIMAILTPIAIAWGLAYLIGSFICASWNITEWSADARFLTGIWGCIWAAALWHKLENSNDIV